MKSRRSVRQFQIGVAARNLLLRVFTLTKRLHAANVVILVLVKSILLYEKKVSLFGVPLTHGDRTGCLTKVFPETVVSV